MSPGSKHIVVHTLPAWSHTKPLISFIVLISQRRPEVTITFLAGAMYPKILKLLADISLNLKNRIRIIDISGPNVDSRKPTLEFVPAFEELYKNGMVKCLSTGTSFEDLPRPTFAIIDPFAGYAVDAIRAIASPVDVPIFVWMSGPVGSTIREFGPEFLGCRGDLWAEVEREVVKTGGDPLEIGEKLYISCKSELIRIPGYPPMYDYEWFPQDQDLGFSALLLRTGRKYIHGTEGTLSVTTSILEAEATRAMTSYMQSIGKDFISIGFVAETLPVKEGIQDMSSDNAIKFLDGMREQFGQHSVIYIAFGSIWWPKDPSKLFVTLEELIKSRTPFLLAHASPFATIPDTVHQQATQSGIGMIVSWAPQDHVLKHPATGWFVTHAGWNSIQEAFRYKVPMIVWPFSADQPLNAALMVDVHKVALELLEVRTGEKGMKELYRLGRWPIGTEEALREEWQGLLKKLKGVEGERARENIQRISTELDGLWCAVGESNAELDRFLNTYVD